MMQKNDRLSDRLKKGYRKSIGVKAVFPVLGLLSFIWFLIRVIPKPSRVNYPCVRAAAPLASGFVLYLCGLFTTVAGYRLFKIQWRRNQSITALFFLCVAAGGLLLLMKNSEEPAYSEIQTIDHPANQPMGEPQGIFPGRVVWIHNPAATNETAQWEDLPRKYNHDAWFLDHNNNQDVIDQMFSDGIRTLTETETDQEAWEAVFNYFNEKKGKGKAGYQSGEKVFIKINVTSGGNGWHMQNFDYKMDSEYGMTETSPHVVLTVLRHLVHVVGVPQEMITVGDPINQIYQDRIDKWTAEFPDIICLDEDVSDAWRTQAEASETAVIDYSDRGEILRTGDWNDAKKGLPVNADYLFKAFEEADYLINLPALKGHKHAGVTMFAKNHFGSQTRETAMHLHGGLIATDNINNNPWRDEYGQYRVQVDLMGHELLGGNTLFFILDALWATDFENDQPDRFQTAPFHNDWTSSLLFSQDMVAIESVGFDIMRTEFCAENYPDVDWGENDKITCYPNMPAVDDYLHQAADPQTWPDNIVYDPENDGTPLTSLGVHEHWNNGIDRQYSGNFNPGTGIELIYQLQAAAAVNDLAGMPETSALIDVYPNPFNPQTTIRYQLKEAAEVQLQIFNVQGQRVQTLVQSHQKPGTYETRWQGMTRYGLSAPSGMYIAKLTAAGQRENNQSSVRLLLVR